MRSLSEKTDIGIHDWMIPEVAVRALRVMEHWSAPHQAIISAEIVQRRRIDPHDPQIAEARKHQHSLFLGVYANEGNQVRTLSGKSTMGRLSFNPVPPAPLRDPGLPERTLRRGG